MNLHRDHGWQLLHLLILEAITASMAAKPLPKHAAPTPFSRAARFVSNTVRVGFEYIVLFISYDCRAILSIR